MLLIGKELFYLPLSIFFFPSLFLTSQYKTELILDSAGMKWLSVNIWDRQVFSLLQSILFEALALLTLLRPQVEVAWEVDTWESSCPSGSTAWKEVGGSMWEEGISQAPGLDPTANSHLKEKKSVSHFNRGCRKWSECVARPTSLFGLYGGKEWNDFFSYSSISFLIVLPFQSQHNTCLGLEGL